MNIDKYLQQTMLYWRKKGSNSSGPTFDQPIPLPCRWEDAQVEMVTPKGRTIESSSHIYTNVDLVEGSMIFLGDGVDPLAAWKLLPGYPRIPDYDQGGREVTKALRTPDVSAQNIILEWRL